VEQMEETLTCGNRKLLREIERRGDTMVSRCLQCHKCSTGCPVAPEMDYMSSQIMQLIILGQEEEILTSKAIWFCASCEACSTRCPMDIDIAGVMDVLRMMAVERGMARPDARSKHFNQAFLTSVRWHARVFEVGMMALYKLRSLDLFSDMDKVPKMLSKRKLALLPHFSRMTRQVRKVFRRAREEETKRQ